MLAGYFDLGSHGNAVGSEGLAGKNCEEANNARCIFTFGAAETSSTKRNPETEGVNTL